MRTDRERLGDILERCELLEKHVAGRLDELESDPVLLPAALYWIQIIGEAAANVSPAVRDRYPDVPWRDTVGMRNVIVHGYFGADVDIVREVVTRDIPRLGSQVRAILEELE